MSMLRHAATTLTTLAITFVFASPANAQGRWGGWGGGGFEPGVTSREVDRYAEILDLDDEQLEVANAMFDAYQAEFQIAADEAQDILDETREEWRETRDPTVWEDMRENMESFQETRDKLNESFLNDLKLVLSDEQAAQWPVLERTRRRERTMRQGLLSGESADLVQILDDVYKEDQPDEQVQPLIERYELELDRALIKRNEVYENGMSRGMELWRSGDMDEMERLYNEARDAGLQVRDINRRFARQIEALLEGESKTEFESGFLSASFPAVYRRTYTDRVFEAVDGFEDLTPEQTESLGQIRQRYDTERIGADKRWREAIETNEMNQSIQDMFRGWGRRGGDDDASQARRDRRDLDQSTIDKVRELLSDTQLERLPERREEAERDGRGGRRGNFQRRGGGNRA